mmetsp:Transcript_1539/g.3277  ORF Transcript_1539/g.3277 Transcript_1539/m.3277 type:complete len:570 (-) Transcript_1539:235-1944(-)|eukprot:CAMPEP_0172327054 /NCGR_PEP_ID=MMETSP1058-20130122/58440_1 /TAXON_ID=83371 /ORGANISM="Detonula confervacea, Strain CCMP 353" /LENGTH=569 /DNA_ID=CAMNT_0013043993 /DNA_START=98 /DNA_END=1807 /DNA_ORIENTATION=+
MRHYYNNFILNNTTLLCTVLIVTVNGFTPYDASSPISAHQYQQQHVRELLQVLDSSVHVFINDHHSELDEIIKPQPVLDACFAVCCALELTDNDSIGKSGASEAHVKLPYLSRLEEQQEEAELTPNVILTHFFEVPLWDAEFQSLASSVRKLTTSIASTTTTATTTFTDQAGYRDDVEKMSERLMRASDIMAASAKFVLLPSTAKTAALDALDMAVAHGGFLKARTMALSLSQQQQRNEDTITEKDERVVEALYECVVQQLGPQFLTSYGFPCSNLGLRGFVAAARAATNTQRAASALGRIWHAANEAGPLIVVPNLAAAACVKANGMQSLEDYTLVVAFSALGWNGIVRKEWGGTLCDSPNVVVVHALDSCKSWFTTNPVTGAADNGSWWDATLANLVAPFGRVCIVGESMGGTAALRFARHASKSGTVVALVPQINLQDFGSAFNVRNDFGQDDKDRLLASIQQSFETADSDSSTRARVVIHVGRNPDDLRQLLYIENSVREHSALGLQADAPLPRYSSHSSHAVGNNGVRVVKHDVEGHAMGAGLKLKGTLRDVILSDLLGSDSWQ